jgi:hypothetical protein
MIGQPKHRGLRLVMYGLYGNGIHMAKRTMGLYNSSVYTATTWHPRTGGRVSLSTSALLATQTFAPQCVDPTKILLDGA